MNSPASEELVAFAVEVEYIPADDNLPKACWRAEIETRGEEQRWCEVQRSNGALAYAVVPPQAGTPLLLWVADCLETALAGGLTSEPALEPGLGAAIVYVVDVEVAAIAFGRTPDEVWFDSAVEQEEGTDATLWALVVKALRQRQVRAGR